MDHCEDESIVVEPGDDYEVPWYKKPPPYQEVVLSQIKDDKQINKILFRK